MKILKIFLCMILCIGYIVPFTIYVHADELSSHYTLQTADSSDIIGYAQWQIVNVDEEYNVYTQRNEYTYQIVRNYSFTFYGSDNLTTPFSGYFQFTDGSVGSSNTPIVSNYDDMSIELINGNTYRVRFSNKGTLSFQSTYYYKNAVDYNTYQSDLSSYTSQSSISQYGSMYMYYKLYDITATVEDQLNSILNVQNELYQLLGKIEGDTSLITDTLLPDIKNQILITNSYLSNIDKNIEQLLLKLNNFYNLSYDTLSLFHFFEYCGGTYYIDNSINDSFIYNNFLVINFNPYKIYSFDKYFEIKSNYPTLYISFLTDNYIKSDMSSIVISNSNVKCSLLDYQKVGKHILYYIKFDIINSNIVTQFSFYFTDLIGKSFNIIPLYSGYNPWNNDQDIADLNSKNDELISATDEYDKVETEYINNATDSIDNIDFNLDLTSLNDFTPTASFVGNQMTSLFNINPALTTVFMFSMILGICLLLIGRSKK